jgi:hypothetical protein
VGDLPEELILLPFADPEIDRLYIRGSSAGRGFAIGNENQMPLEAAEAAGWRYIHAFDSSFSCQQGAVGVNVDRDVVAVVDGTDGLWAVNITEEQELEIEELLNALEGDSPSQQ